MICPQCKATFVQTRGGKVYCSRKCQQKAAMERYIARQKAVKP